MITAAEAKRNAESSKLHSAEVTTLGNHLEQLIKTASHRGQFELKDKPVFPQDRFKQTTIDEVLETLQKAGYKVAISKNNAQQQIIFHITW